MKNSKRIIGLILAPILAVSCCDCPTGNPDAITITTEEALDLEKGYVENQYELISQTFPEDSREVLFTDIDALRSFLIKVQNEGEERGLDNVGVRVYLGAKEVNGISSTTVFLAGVAAPNENLEPDGEPYPQPKDFLTMALFANKGSMGNNNLEPIESELINP